MATSSITHNFVIKTAEDAERFANAVEYSLNHPVPLDDKDDGITPLTDRKKIAELLMKRKHVADTGLCIRHR